MTPYCTIQDLTLSDIQDLTLSDNGCALESQRSASTFPIGKRLMHEVVQIKDELAQIGVSRGDVLMVHASLRGLGPIRGGAESLIDTISQALGPEGTMLMVLGADPAQPFDRLKTPADKYIGMLAEVFRSHPGVHVSDHLVARYAALGARAKELIDDVPLNDYHGPGSVLERIIRVDGKVLRLGADMDSLTLTHYAEYLADLPNKRRVRRKWIRADTGPLWVECLDDDDGIVPFDEDEIEEDEEEADYFPQLLSEYLSAERARTGPIGSCNAQLIHSRDFIEFAVPWLENELRPLMTKQV